MTDRCNIRYVCQPWREDENTDDVVFILNIHGSAAWEIEWVLGRDPSPLDSIGGSFRRTYSQLIPISGVAVQARQSMEAGTVSILCSLAGRYGYSAEQA